MSQQKISPQKQIDRIEQMVFKAKMNIEDNGFAFILWGTIIALASFGQVLLMNSGQNSISWYPYLLMPLTAIFTFFYYARKERSKKNPIETFYARLWIFTGLNIMLIAFFFSHLLRENLTPIILILIGLATLFSGGVIRSNPVLYSGVLLHIGGYWAFFLPWKHHPILMGVLGIFAVLLPGIVLAFYHKKRHV